MAIERLDHVSIRTADVERSVAFYRKALGLLPGPRPPFRFPVAWLYRAGEDGSAVGGALVHVIGIDREGAEGLHDYLGEREAGTARGTGAFDHAAFACSGIDEMRARLAAEAIAFRERVVPEIGLRQLFVEDTDGVTLELNFGD